MTVQQDQYKKILEYYSVLSQLEKSKMYLDSTTNHTWFKWFEDKDLITKQEKLTLVDCRNICTYEDYIDYDHIKIIDYGDDWEAKGWASQHRLRTLNIFEEIYNILFTYKVDLDRLIKKNNSTRIN